MNNLFMLRLFPPLLLITVIIIAGDGIHTTNAIKFNAEEAVGYERFTLPPLHISNNTSIPDGMIVRCYNTLCRDWMHECHWFCNSDGKSGRCMECLSWRGQHCYDCFKLLS